MKKFYLLKPLMATGVFAIGAGCIPVLADEQPDEYNSMLVKHEDGRSESFLLDEIRHITFQPEADSFVILKKAGESHTFAFDDASHLAFVTSEPTSLTPQTDVSLKSRIYRLPNGNIAVCPGQETEGWLLISIIDMNGRICRQQTFTSLKGDAYVLEGNDLKQGIYMIHLKSAEYTETLKYLHSHR